jgi:hypothetical protein
LVRDIHIEAPEDRAPALGASGVRLVIAVVMVAILTAVIIVGVGALRDPGHRPSCDAARPAPRTAVATRCR